MRMTLCVEAPYPRRRKYSLGPALELQTLTYLILSGLTEHISFQDSPECLRSKMTQLQSND